MAQDWDIRPRGDACHGCGRAYADGDVCFSCLVFDAEGYRRADYCGACWPSRQVDAAPFSSWQGSFHAPPPAPEEPLKKETAESLLRRLMEDDDEARINVIYILAVMLERNKTLVERATRRRDDGLVLRIYEHRRTGETFVVPEPHLQLDQLEHVQREVVEMLGGNARAPAADTPAPADPTPAAGAGAIRES